MYKLFVFVCFGMLTYCAAQNYCNIASCRGKPHTMCQYTSPNPSSACTGVSSNSLSNTEKNEIVKTHNTYRQKVASGNELRGSPGPQPAAKEMPNLVWDNELATIAQRWANQCIFEHDKCRDIQRGQVGQNIGYRQSSNPTVPNVNDFIKSWYDEVVHFNKNDVTSYTFNSGTGHYTQIVWANTRRIGCGKISYRENNNYRTMLVCNYEPAGNWQGQKVYQPK